MLHIFHTYVASVLSGYFCMFAMVFVFRAEYKHRGKERNVGMG
jgi:hypothetical protein